MSLNNPSSIAQAEWHNLLDPSFKVHQGLGFRAFCSIREYTNWYENSYNLCQNLYYLRMIQLLLSCMQGREFVFPTLSLDVYALLVLNHNTLWTELLSEMLAVSSLSYSSYSCLEWNKLCSFLQGTLASKSNSSGSSSGHLPLPLIALPLVAT